jgi:hypothetical protein
VRAASGLRTSKPHLLYVSDLTFAEIRFGIEHADARKRAELTEWLSGACCPSART